MFYTTDSSNTLAVWHDRTRDIMVMYWFNVIDDYIIRIDFGAGVAKEYYEDEYKIIREINSQVITFKDLIKQLHKNNIMSLKE